MRRQVTVEQVIALHDTMESAPVIDRGKLDAAIGRAYQGWGNSYFYPSVFSQAAVLMHGIAAAHAFLDGNKRTAWAAAMVALEMNGVSIIRIDDESMASYMEEVALHVHTIEETALLLSGLIEF